MWQKTAPWLAVAVLLVWGILAVRCAVGQTVTSDVGAMVEVWTGPEDKWQNRMQVRGQVLGKWGPLRLRVWMSGVWWGASDAKIAGSLLNAEAGRVLERRHGASVYGQWGGLQVGATVHRRAVHHIWRHKSRHRYFPGSWQIGRRGCNGASTPSYPPGQGCPSIGYWDGVRPQVGYEGHGWDVRLRGPLVRWKTLTLPWPRWMGTASYETGAWTVTAEGRVGGPAGWSADFGVRRELIGPVEIGLRAGQVALPVWTENTIRRISTTITLD